MRALLIAIAMLAACGEEGKIGSAGCTSVDMACGRACWLYDPDTCTCEPEGCGPPDLADWLYDLRTPPSDGGTD